MTERNRKKIERSIQKNREKIERDPGRKKKKEEIKMDTEWGK